MNPRRIERLQEQIKERVAEIVDHELSDPRKGFVTITRVKLDTEVEHCIVYFSVLGGEKERRQNQEVLDGAARHVQREVGAILTLRKVPHVRFVFDESIEGSAKMQGLLDRLRKEREQRELAQGESGEDELAQDELGQGDVGQDEPAESDGEPGESEPGRADAGGAAAPGSAGGPGDHGSMPRPGARGDSGAGGAATRGEDPGTAPVH